MHALLKNNVIQKGILCFLILIFVSFLIIPVAAFATHISGDPIAGHDQAGGNGVVDPKSSTLSWTTMMGQVVGNFILYVASGFLYMGGMLLEMSIDKFILQLGSLINSSGIGNSIDTVWRIVRDMANLAFIFGFIYIGIRTIIDADSSSTKRMLASIIIGALLINFSLFFTKVVIDASNYIAVEIYNSLTTGSGSIAQSFMDAMGLVSLFKPLTGDALANLTTGGNIFFYFMGSIFLIVAGFVLAAGAILLIVRFVKLVFIMIFSPVLFAATVFPQTQATASKLWHELINYSFFAPAYLLLLLVSLTLLKGFMATMYGNGPTPAFSDALAGKVTGYGVVINFMVAIMFLIMSLQIAMKFGIAGADRVMSVGKDLRGRGQKFLGRTAGAATFGLGAKVGRATVGRYAHNMSGREGLKDRASRGGVGGFVARQQLKASKAVGDASFDARNVAGVGKTAGIGEGRKGGYTTVKKEIEDKEMKYAKSLGEVGDEDEQVVARKKAMDDAKKNLDRDRESLRKQMRDGDTEVKRETARAQLAQLEDTHREAQEAHSREKQRRVLGSASHVENEKTVKDAKEKLDIELDALKEIQSQAAAATTETEREMLAKMAGSLHEQVADAKKNYKAAQKEASKSMGYAGVLQKSRWFNAWPKGRLRAHEHEAGEAIRKAFEKKVKKSKEDSRHEELMDATKASKAAAAKDDH